ncbi:MAG: 30S ribosomal protein S20 [Clostridia bacterium]|nr:30S ribosomal protein S20 [Clostridia bacterium]
MPNIKSAKKRVKVIATKTLQNQMVKSQLKTAIKKFEASLEGGKDDASVAFANVIKKTDQAVAKGILHKNTAARRKGQYAAKMNKLA